MYNTLVAEKAEEYVKAGVKLVEKRLVPTCTLVDILDRYLPRGRKLDLLNIDVEGADEEILRSNDWSRYRPSVLIVEQHGAAWRTVGEAPIVEYLAELGYELVTICGVSLILKEQSSLA